MLRRLEEQQLMNPRIDQAGYSKRKQLLVAVLIGYVFVLIDYLLKGLLAWLGMTTDDPMYRRLLPFGIDKVLPKTLNLVNFLS